MHVSVCPSVSGDGLETVGHYALSVSKLRTEDRALHCTPVVFLCFRLPDAVFRGTGSTGHGLSPRRYVRHAASNTTTGNKQREDLVGRS